MAFDKIIIKKMYSNTFKSNSALFNSLLQQKFISCPLITQVLSSVDRVDFVREGSEELAYYDSPISIGYNVTISAPHMHAFALETLKDKLKTAKRCLDVGSGTGYLTLAFAKMMLHHQKLDVGEPGEVVSYGVEHIPELVKLSKENIKKSHGDFLERKVVQIFEEDGREGLPSHGPYDCIHVGAAVYEGKGIVEALVNQLSLGGRLVAPIGTPESQDFVTIDKNTDGEISIEKHIGVRYVPLCSKNQQINDN